ncbi:S-type pyocin domain-containing protein [Erwiniaceae bacterium BAC15a-03b]|uniref:S-type pyocin domain-containing protein n=1 Tax=Winslowiella arboricola TaxID=2978220 RepID=A0A9J6PNC9_9GAMM|nr:colicin D domain-containing protein [Winslowiella arboricola]MCU5772840.1 S-type pyocin domain-containing protein [Winslowiella arboricola]MCU5777144.1 S-type pyocin domain-containing protein [Winslowiella arboricola]
MAGNGADNAHNNQFGGGSRGPTGGVNTGSGSGNSGGERGYGYWSTAHIKEDKSAITYDEKGEPRIEIRDGARWVGDNSIHWSDDKGGSGNANLRTNVTAPIKEGFQAAIDGYIYTVTVNGSDQITAVNLFSRPAQASRKDWAGNEAARKNSAKALVQAQINAKKVAAAAAAKKEAETKAAAEAKHKAAEDAKRKQAEWDAAHPLEAAQRNANTAQTALNSATQSRSSAQTSFNTLSTKVNQRQAEYNSAVAAEEVRRQEWLKTPSGAPANTTAGMFERAKYSQYQAAKKVTADKKSTLDAVIKQRQDAQSKLSAANASYNTALASKKNADTALAQAQADAKAKRDAEIKRQAEEATRIKAQQEADAKARAVADAEAKAAAEAATKVAAKEAAMSRLEEPNVFGVKALAAAMAVSKTPMVFAETGLGTISLSGKAATAAWAFVRGVVSELSGVAIAGTSIGALIASIAYIPKAGEGSADVPGRNNINMFSTVMDPSALNLPDDKTIKAALKSGGTVDSLVRGRVYYDNDRFNTELVRTEKPTTINVVNAVIDEATGFYGYTIPATDTLPSRTILVSPDSVPEAGGLPPLVTPIVTEVGISDTGNHNVPDTDFNIETYPLTDEPDFSDFILVFEELNLKPMYVMFQDSLDDGRFTRKQLDRKFKHAPDFGINDTKKNRETLAKFRDAIEAHLEDPSTIEKGTYSMVEGSRVYFNEKTLRVVIIDKQDMFVSGWLLDPKALTSQYQNYINTGVLR